ncbi:uncharacterized protein ARB_07918 [Trichophyton benhamiae CBS 112371]|uniref:Uncharacterized protein n=1 Tax=Arthroderma benhamiae (strain ATCC MYA-4681 / CBS 112371) TaxID=663331 RepID=D4AUK1_ARTBC|nr:uncharacterized protein ARB_07918 [Trichophyton benhamiae CBS 112371]EFE33166.1 hypothetical protein ARB_07918 [Trichophyton benhamiae CBS 112371]
MAAVVVVEEEVKAGGGDGREEEKNKKKTKTKTKTKKRKRDAVPSVAMGNGQLVCKKEEATQNCTEHEREKKKRTKAK